MEVEAKFTLAERVTPEQIETLGWGDYRLGERQTIDQHDTFFDTAELALSRTRHAVRVREGHASLIVTLKGPGTVKGSIHSREEWETTTPSSAPEAWPTEIRAQLDKLIGPQKLQPLLQVHNLRRTWTIQHVDRIIGELALDEGTIEANGQQQPMHELEIELKGGTNDDLHQLSELVQQQLPARPEAQSKFARGLALLGLVKPEAAS